MRRSILFFLLLVAVHAVQGQDYYVDGSQPDNNGTGQIDDPWRTIEYAVEQVKTTSGSINIFIADGEYEIEPILIDNPTWNALTFAISSTLGGGGVIIKASDSGSAEALFTVSEAQVTFRNLVLEGAVSDTEKTAQAISVSNAELVVTSCEIRNFALGLGLTPTTNAIVSGCFFDGNTTGVQVLSSGDGGETPSGSITINTNSFTNNNQAVANESTLAINAERNWWGGALRATVRDALGLGPDQVGGNVDYSPWLANDNDEGTFGFDVPLDVPSALGIDNDSPALGADPGSNLQMAYSQAGSGDTLVLAGVTPFSQLIADELKVLSNETSDAIITIENLVVSVNVAPTEDDTLRFIKGKLLIPNSLVVSAGNLKTTLDSSQVILGDNIITTTADLDAKLTGDFSITPRNLDESSTLNILGLEIGSGASLSNLRINRINGAGSAVTFGENKSINSKWIIAADPTELDPGRDLEFSWSSQNDNNKEFDINAATLWRSEDGTEWELITTTDGPLSTDDTELRSVLASGVTNFSTWTVSDEASPLPVTLTDFTARLEESSVRLRWTTASEINSDYFNIERSTDGQTYQPLGRRPAAGSSQTEQTYQYTDEGVANRLAGTVYYRLHMVDFDGSSEYSPVVAVSLEGESDLLVYANREDGTFKLFASLPETAYTVQVSDMIGNIVYEAPLPTQPNVREYALPVPTLPKSVYTLRCLGVKELYVRKFRVE